MAADRPPPWLQAVQRLDTRLRGKPSLHSATVTATDPVTVQLDGPPVPGGLPVATSHVHAQVGDRVDVLMQGTVLTVIGHRDVRGVADQGYQTFSTLAIPAGQGRTVAVTFRRPLPAVPIVQTTFQDAPGGTTFLVSRATAVTKTGFTLVVHNVGTVEAAPSAQYRVGWTAIL